MHNAQLAMAKLPATLWLDRVELPQLSGIVQRASSALCIVHRALPRRPLVPVDDVPEPEGLVEDRTFLGSAACLWSRLVDAVGEAAQGEGLEPHLARAGQRCEE